MCVCVSACTSVCCFFAVSDTFCSAAACQMSHFQILWQIGMLKLWFQPGYINPQLLLLLLLPHLTAQESGAAIKDVVRGNYSVSSERSGCLLLLLLCGSPGGAVGAAGGGQVVFVVGFAVLSVYICPVNRADKGASALKAERRRFKRLWQSRFGVRLRLTSLCVRKFHVNLMRATFFPSLALTRIH